MTKDKLRDVLLRLRRDWPGKVGAVVVACVLWFVATSDPESTAQRSLLVPLEVTGAEANEVAVGVPSRVEVVVSGPSERMNRLESDEVDAFLDLTDVDGEFAQTVDARVPASLRLVGVVPSEVIGRLEAVRSRELPIRVTVASASDDQTVASVRVEPERATVEARDLVLEQVDAVVAARIAIDEAVQSVVLVAVDSDGVPIPEARVVPPRAAVEITLERRNTVVTRPVVVTPPSSELITIESVVPAVVALVGPPGRLDAIVEVSGRVPGATSSLPSGRYDLPVRLDLPPDVASRDQVLATVLIRSTPPSGDAPTDP